MYCTFLLLSLYCVYNFFKAYFEFLWQYYLFNLFFVFYLDSAAKTAELKENSESIQNEERETNKVEITKNYCLALDDQSLGSEN